MLFYVINAATLHRIKKKNGENKGKYWEKAEGAG